MILAWVGALALGVSSCTTTTEGYGNRPPYGGPYGRPYSGPYGSAYAGSRARPYERTAATAGYSSAADYSGQRTAAEQRLRDQSQALANTSAQACLTVGAVSALGAYLLTRKGEGHRGRNAALAGLAGCGIGIGVNSYVQTRRQQYAGNEERLRVMTQELRADNQRLAGLVDTTRQVVADDRAKVDAIDRAIEAKHLDVAEARERLTSVTANRDQLYQNLATLEAKQRQWQEVSQRERQSGGDTTALDQEIARLEAQIAVLKREIELLDERIEISPVAA